MLTSDLTPLLLALAQWGVADPASLPWLDPPPAAALDAARGRLQALGALDGERRITARGREIAALPMAPWQAAMLLHGADYGMALDAAKIALLLQERGLGGRGEDLAQRLDRWNADRSSRAEAAEAGAGLGAARARSFDRLSRNGPRNRKQTPFTRACRRARTIGSARGSACSRTARQSRPPPRSSGESWSQRRAGAATQLDPDVIARSRRMARRSAMRRGKPRARAITAALPLATADVEHWLGERIERRSVLRWTGERVEARLERRLGAIALASGPDPAPDEAAVTALLVEKAVEKLGDILPAALLARARYAGIVELAPARLAETADLWLAPLVAGRRDLDIPAGVLAEAVLSQVDWESRQRLDRLAPRKFTTPAETTHAIDYAGADAPAVEVRVQALFGLDSHPMVGDTPLLLKLTSPAGRPIQATRDLPGFWRGSWKDVVKDMKGRYPKHRWPEAPWTEKPSLKTKNAFSRTQS